MDVLLVNPYQAVDFGTFPAGRHFIKGLYGQPLYRGLFIDQCYDVGRIEDVHFWSFWGGWDGELHDFMRAEAVAFILGKTDWEFLTRLLLHRLPHRLPLRANQAGPGNCLLTQCGSDIGPTAVRVESVQAHAGISFVNGQFMAGIEVAKTNTGPVKFTACGFWGIPTTDHHALLEGAGHTTFSGCHFIGWGQRDKTAPAILARSGGLTVTGCDFMDLGKAQITLEPEVEAALDLRQSPAGEAAHHQPRRQLRPDCDERSLPQVAAMKILFLGGTGNISTECAALLHQRGHEILVLSRGRNAVPPGYQAIVADRKDPAAMRAALQGRAARGGDQFPRLRPARGADGLRVVPRRPCANTSSSARPSSMRSRRTGCR